jgi:hypothetical protein
MSKIRRLVGLGIVVVVIGALLYYAPAIVSFVQTLSSSNASYTSLMVREYREPILDFGDTEYSFYLYSNESVWVFYVNTFIGGRAQHTPSIGDTYRDFGIEIRVSIITSDYVSNYMVILVKPTVQNYMASLHYTRMNITFGKTEEVNISSGLTNETNSYSFTYSARVYSQVTQTFQSTSEPQLEIQSINQTEDYPLYSLYGTQNTKWDFNIEVDVFKVDSSYIVIYVKPLY